MTTRYMETVSLTDDASVVSSTSSSSSFLDVNHLEAQLASNAAVQPSKDETTSLGSVTKGTSQNTDVCMQSMGSIHDPLNPKQGHESVVVDMENRQQEIHGVSSQNGNKPQVLPPLRILTQNLPIEEHDYVDTTLFSPEVSNHAMEVAHRRAKAIAAEVKEMSDLEIEVVGPAKAKMSPAEAVGIIGGAFANSLQRAKKLVTPGTKEYDLLSGTSPLERTSKLDDLDTDGDGLQLSPDAIKNDGTHFRMTKLRPALKRISAYSTTATALEPEKSLHTRPQKKKNILWHEDVLDADEEFYEDDTDGQETCSLMKADEDAVGCGNGSPRPQLLNYSSKKDGQLTPRSRKKRKKKLVRSMMRRLTPREKEELYRQRPDLMIVPNWAQKYREELAGEGSTRWNAWLFGLIMVMTVLLLVFVLVIVRQRAAAAT